MTLLGELVGEVFAAFSGADLGDDMMLQQTLEALSEDVGGDAFGGGEEVFETTPAKHEIANDEQRPAVAEDVEGARHGAR